MDHNSCVTIYLCWKPVPRNLTLFHMTYLIHSDLLSRRSGVFGHWCVCLAGMMSPYTHTHLFTNKHTPACAYTQTNMPSGYTSHRSTFKQTRATSYIHPQTLGCIALLQRVIYYTELNTHWHFMLSTIPLTWLVISDSHRSLPSSLLVSLGRRFNATAKLRPFPLSLPRGLQGLGLIALSPPHPYHSLN